MQIFVFDRGTEPDRPRASDKCGSSIQAKRFANGGSMAEVFGDLPTGQGAFGCGAAGYPKASVSVEVAYVGLHDVGRCQFRGGCPVLCRSRFDDGGNAGDAVKVPSELFGYPRREAERVLPSKHASRRANHCRCVRREVRDVKRNRSFDCAEPPNIKI